MDLLDTKILSNAEKEETVQNYGAATVVALNATMLLPALVSLSLSG